MSLYDEKEIREQRVTFGFILYVLLTCIVYILPYTKFVVPYIIAALIMLGSLLFTVFKQDNNLLYIVILLFMSALFVVLYWANGLLMVDCINEWIRNIRFFIPVFWALYALKYCNQKQKNFFIILFSIVVVFLFIRTSIELEKDPWIARKLAQGKETSTDEVNAYRLNNVGGFEFSYMMGIVTLCLLYAALKVEKLLLKIIFVILTILSFNYIITTMYATLLLLTLVGMFILLFVNIKNKGIKILLAVFAVLTLFFLEDILLFLSTAFSEGSLLNEKFHNIYLSFVEEDANVLGSRPQLILDSLKKWINNPIFGKVDSTSNSHSMVIQILEQTGLVGLFIISFVFIALTKRIYKLMEEKELPTSLFTISIIFLVVLAFLNPIGYCFEITIAVYFIVPLLTEFFAQFKKGED